MKTYRDVECGNCGKTMIVPSDNPLWKHVCEHCGRGGKKPTHLGKYRERSGTYRKDW